MGTKGAPWSSEGTSTSIFALMLNLFRDSFGSSFATQTKQIKQKKTKRYETKQVGTDPNAVSGLGQTYCIKKEYGTRMGNMSFIQKEKVEQFPTNECQLQNLSSLTRVWKVKQALPIPMSIQGIFWSSLAVANLLGTVRNDTKRQNI